MRKLLKIIFIVVFIAAIINFFWDNTNDVSDYVVDPQENMTISEAQNNENKVYTISSEDIFESKKERFVAHRGFSDHAPENSIPSFERAGKAGFWGIETDIIESADGVFMCMHDETLERTTTGTGNLNDYTYSELMNFRIDFGNDVSDFESLKIPTMIEFLNNCVIYDCVPIIEIKEITDYEGFLETVKNSGLYNRSIITGSLADLKEIRKIDKNVLVMLVAYATLDYSAYEPLLPELGENSGILLNAPLITRAVADDLHKRGYRIGAWTLDTPDDARKYMDLGADFVVTNNIPGLKHMINENE